MIDPSVIGKIVEIAKQIYDQVEKTKKLRPLANDLAYRIRVIQEQIDKLKALQDTSHLDNSIKRLQGIIDKSLTYATKIAKMHDALKFLKAGGLTTEHTGLMKELDSVIIDLGAALNTAILHNQVVGAKKSEEYQAELAAHQKEFEANLKTDLISLQTYALEIVAQGDAAKDQLDGLSVTVQDIKAKLDNLHQEACKINPKLPSTIKVTVLTKGASAKEVIHEVILGIGIGDLTIPEGANRETIDMAKELAAFMLNETLAAQKIAPPVINVEVTVVEVGAYAELVKEKTQQAQPGKLTITARAAPSPSTKPAPTALPQ